MCDDIITGITQIIDILQDWLVIVIRFDLRNTD